MFSILLLFLLPLCSAFIFFLLHTSNRQALKAAAVALSCLPLGYLLLGFTQWVGIEENYPWVTQLGVNFHLKMDGVALLFVYLAAIIVPISLLSVKSQELTHPHTFYFLVLTLLGLLIGFFTARDLVVFVLFYEALIIPLYFIISLWGGDRRYSAAIRFLVYMIAGSVFLIAALLALYVFAGTFDMDALAQQAASSPYALWIFAAFLLAFAVKTPLFPFHAWLPDAYTQAPTAGTILLSALLSKAGIYGLLRVNIAFFPDLLKEWSPYLLALAITGVFYGGLCAWAQRDFKRLIAYSSFSHVNFILAGLFIWAQPGHTGAVIQALNHGVTIAGLFLVAGWLETRLGSRSMSNEGGLARFLPHLCWLTLFFVLSSVALPGLNNFVGELLILFGLFRENVWLAAFLSLSVVLSVIYMLRWMETVYFGAPTFFQERWADIRAKEFAIAMPLIFLILFLGIYPKPVLELIKPTTEKTVAVAHLEMPR
jgi:NADH-quinone oxidoreductase subunit M